MNFNNLNKAVLIGDLVCLDGVHFIVINVNKYTVNQHIKIVSNFNANNVIN